MSSEVQAKWVNSATCGQGASRSRRKYSTALTSWLVVRSIAFTASASASQNPSAAASRHARASGSGSGPTPGSAANRASHAASTRTRARMSACSLNQGRSSAAWRA